MYWDQTFNKEKYAQNYKQQGKTEALILMLLWWIWE